MKAQLQNPFLATMKSNPLNRFRSARAGALTTFILLPMALPVSAVDRTWDGLGADDNWMTAGNWGGTAPAAGDRLIFDGTAKLLTNNNNYSDALAAGNVFAGIQFNSAAGAFTLSGNRLRTGAFTIDFSANPSADITQTINNNFLITGDNIVTVTTQTNGAITLGGVISDGANAGKLTKTGAGTLTLNGANNFGGQISINEGIVNANTIANAGTPSSLGDGTRTSGGGATPIIRIGSETTSGTLVYTGTAATSTNRQIRVGDGNTASDTGGASIVNDNANTAHTLTFSNSTFNSAHTGANADRTLTLGGTNTGLNTISGAIVDNAAGDTVGLTKEGAGTWVLAGVSTFTGPITINGGTLEFTATNGGNGIFGSTQININGASTLRVSGTAANIPIFKATNYTFDSVGGGKIELGAGGNYDAGVANEPFSITTQGGAQNTIKIINDGVSGANGFNLGGSVATFDVALGSHATSDLVVTPIMSNGGSIVKSGAGRLELTGANTYRGATSVDGGELLVNGTHTVTTGGNGYTVSNADSTLGGTGRLAINGNVSVGSGAILAPGASIGTLTLDGVNTAGNVLTMTTGAEFGFELAGNGGTPDRLDFWNYLAGDLVLNDNAIELSLLGTQAAGTYNVDIFRFFSDGGGAAATHAFASGLTIGTLGTGISSALIDWNGTGDNNQTIALTYTVIPEPRAALLGGLGLLCLLRRRRA